MSFKVSGSFCFDFAQFQAACSTYLDIFCQSYDPTT